MTFIHEGQKVLIHHDATWSPGMVGTITANSIFQKGRLQDDDNQFWITYGFYPGTDIPERACFDMGEFSIVR